MAPNKCNKYFMTLETFSQRLKAERTEVADTIAKSIAESLRVANSKTQISWITKHTEAHVKVVPQPVSATDNTTR